MRIGSLIGGFLAGSAIGAASVVLLGPMLPSGWKLPGTTPAASTPPVVPPPPGAHLSPQRENALKAPVSELALESLQGGASALVEVERPTHIGLGGPEAPLYGLRFATGATSAGNPGLCRATVLWVPTTGREGPDGAPQSEPAFKVVGDLAATPDGWSADLEAQCRTAGRVIPTESGDFSQSRFFTLDEYPVSYGVVNSASYGARALQLVIAQAPKKPAPPCEPLHPDDAEACAHPRASLAALKLSTLLTLAVRPCGSGELCIRGSFLRGAEFNVEKVWVLEVRATVQHREVTGARLTQFGASRGIYD